MTVSEPLEEYLAGIPDDARPSVRALDAAVRAASPDLDVALRTTG